MRHLALILAAMLGTAQADTGIDGVFVLSKDLGYESAGFGLQLDHDGRQGNWGWDVQATALKHAKINAKGERFQIIGMGRRFFGPHFVEAGVEYGGYDSRFPDGSEWVKYGVAPAIGIGTVKNQTEWTLRLFAPDSTPNKTSVIAVSGETRIGGNWVLGGTLEHWRFDIRGERWPGNQLTIKMGWRF